MGWVYSYLDLALAWCIDMPNYDPFVKGMDKGFTITWASRVQKTDSMGTKLKVSVIPLLHCAGQILIVH